jgi:ferritin-like metal-binding protein YciE
VPHKTTKTDRAVIAKYVLEAHGKERQLETALQAQIVGAKSPDAEAALIDHLEVTRKQIRALEKRLTELGHDPSSLPGIATVLAGAGLVSTVANKSLALVKGPIQLARGTSPADNEVRNLRDCYWNEAEEIAHYRVIETIAGHLGDTTTARLARAHRKEEEAMQSTLDELISEATRAVAETEGTLPPRTGSAKPSDDEGASVSGRAKRKLAGTQAGR